MGGNAARQMLPESTAAPILDSARAAKPSRHQSDVSRLVALNTSRIGTRLLERSVASDIGNNLTLSRAEDSSEREAHQVAQSVVADTLDYDQPVELPVARFTATPVHVARDQDDTGDTGDEGDDPGPGSQPPDTAKTDDHTIPSDKPPRENFDKRLQFKVEEALGDAKDTEDPLNKAYYYRVVILLQYTSPDTFYDDYVAGKFIDDALKTATDEQATADKIDPSLLVFTAAFPVLWGKKVFDAMYLAPDPALVSALADALANMAEVGGHIPTGVLSNGLPVPFSDAVALAQFKLMPAHADLKQDSVVKDFAIAVERYVKSVWPLIFFDTWNRFAHRLQDQIAKGDWIIDYYDYWSFTHDQPLQGVKTLTQRLSSAKTDQQYKQIDDEVASLATLNLIQRVISSLTWMQGPGSYWAVGSRLFDASLKIADAFIAIEDGSTKQGQAFVWATRNDYFSAAQEEILEAIADKASDSFWEIVGIGLLQLIPGVDVAVDIYLGYKAVKDIYEAFSDEAAASEKVTESMSVVALQRSAAHMAIAHSSTELRLMLDGLQVAGSLRSMKSAMSKIQAENPGISSKDALIKATGETPAPAATPSPGPAPGGIGGAIPKPPRIVRIFHGTGQSGLRGISEAGINVAHAPGVHQDFGQAFYVSEDIAVAEASASRSNLARGGGPTHVLAWEIPENEFGKIVDIRPDGAQRALWDQFLAEPPSIAQPGSPLHGTAGFRTNREFLDGFGVEHRGEVFEEFLSRNNMSDADTIIGEVAGAAAPPTGPSTQIAIRTQRVADRLNAIIERANSEGSPLPPPANTGAPPPTSPPPPTTPGSPPPPSGGPPPTGGSPPPTGAPPAAPAAPAAADVQALADHFTQHLGETTPTQVTVGRVGFGDIEVAMSPQGPLQVRRSLIVNIDHIPDQGKVMQGAWEQAAQQAGRNLGAGSVEIALRNVQNQTWAEYLRTQGYEREVLPKLSGGFGMEVALVKRIKL